LIELVQPLPVVVTNDHRSVKSHLRTVLRLPVTVWNQIKPNVLLDY